MYSNEYPQFKFRNGGYLHPESPPRPPPKKECSFLKSYEYVSLIEEGWEFHEFFLKSIPFDDGVFEYKPIFNDGGCTPKNSSSKPVLILRRKKGISSK